MTTATSPEMATLKSRLKALWEAGDFSEIAKHIETTAADFVERLNIQPGTKVLDVACGSGNLAVLAAQKGADVTGVASGWPWRSWPRMRPAARSSSE